MVNVDIVAGREQTSTHIKCITSIRTQLFHKNNPATNQCSSLKASELITRTLSTFFYIIPPVARVIIVYKLIFGKYTYIAQNECKP